MCYFFCIDSVRKAVSLIHILCPVFNFVGVRSRQAMDSGRFHLAVPIGPYGSAFIFGDRILCKEDLEQICVCQS